MIYWITGEPGSGKTTFSIKLKEAIDAYYKREIAILIDGDAVRNEFDSYNNKVNGFTMNGIKNQIHRCLSMARIINSQGFIPICALVSPTVELRQVLTGDSQVSLIHTPIDPEKSILWVNSNYEIPIKEECAKSPKYMLDLFDNSRR